MGDGDKCNKSPCQLTFEMWSTWPHRWCPVHCGRRIEDCAAAPRAEAGIKRRECEDCLHQRSHNLKITWQTPENSQPPHPRLPSRSRYQNHTRKWVCRSSRQ